MNHAVLDNVHPPAAAIAIARFVFHSDISHTIIGAVLSWAAVALVSKLATFAWNKVRPATTGDKKE